jgi:hypothetical protein
MTSERIGHSGHSYLGIASFVLSFVPAVLLVILVSLILLLASRQPPGADETGYGFLVLVLVLGTLLCEFVALGLGIAGALQRQRKRKFAFLGIACSVLAVTTILSLTGPVNLARLAAGLTEPQPKVHVVSPGNE